MAGNPGQTDAAPFAVDLRGIVALLSEHIYSSPRVYLRELLQNAVDAITARGVAGDPVVGEIRLEVTAGESPTLVVEDNGCGLTLDEVYDLLATIGQSSKRAQPDESRFLGRFGIGMLSAFLVADEVVFITRSYTGAPAVEWRGRLDGTYRVRTLAHLDRPPGSAVYLRARPDAPQWLAPTVIADLARSFGEFLPVPIRLTVQDAGDGTPPWTDIVIGGRTLPWRVSGERDHLLRWARASGHGHCLDAFPVRVDEVGLDGAVFISAEPAPPTTRSDSTVYLRRMLLSHTVRDVLPEWAFFARCVLNAGNLRPTASREHLVDDASLAAVRAALGDQIRHWLLDVVRNDPERLRALVRVHDRGLRAVAAHDDDLLEALLPVLPFDTSEGVLTLAECLRYDDRLRYVATVDEFRQLGALSAAHGRLLINAGYSYCTDIVQRLPFVVRGCSVELVTAADVVGQFPAASAAEQASASVLLDAAHDIAAGTAVVELRRILPTSLPALFVPGEKPEHADGSPEDSRPGDVWDRILSGLTAEHLGRSDPTTFALNLANPVVSRLAALDDPGHIRRVVELVWVQALLAAQQPLTLRDRAMLASCLDALVAAAAGPAPGGPKTPGGPKR